MHVAHDALRAPTSAASLQHAAQGDRSRARARRAQLSNRDLGKRSPLVRVGRAGQAQAGPRDAGPPGPGVLTAAGSRASPKRPRQCPARWGGIRLEHGDAPRCPRCQGRALQAQACWRRALGRRKPLPGAASACVRVPRGPASRPCWFGTCRRGRGWRAPWPVTGSARRRPAPARRVFTRAGLRPRARPRASAFLPAVPSDVFFINSVWKGYYEYLGKRQPATLTVDWFNATSSKVNATFTEGPRVELKLTGRSRALQARPPRARRGERVPGAWAPRGCVSARADNCATRHVLIPKVTKQNQHEKAS